MEENECPSAATESGIVESSTEASLRLELTDLLLGRPRDVLMGQKGSNSEQGVILERIEAALEAYGSYFYPPSTS